MESESTIKDFSRVSDVISVEDIDNWNKDCLNRNIFIEAGTGSGKSYFIKNKLYDYAKAHNQKILFLIHRTNCVDEFTKEIETDNKTDHITIRTYQKTGFKNALSEKDTVAVFDLENYDYIVCDEAHYFTGDSQYNHGTYHDFIKIMKLKNPIKIMMSATSAIFQEFCSRYKIKFIQYCIDYNYDHIRELNFFVDVNVIHKTIDECIERNVKCLFFISKIELCYELYSKYKSISIFNCSKHNKMFSKYIDSSKYDEMLKNQRFESQFLFTTTAMDAGVNIVMPELNEILIHVFDVDTVMQCIGRKRFANQQDYVNLRIKSPSNHDLSYKLTECIKAINIADNFTKHGTSAYIAYNKGIPDKYNMIVDNFVDGHTEKMVNLLKYQKYSNEKVIIEKMLATKYGYNKYVAERLLRTEHWSVLNADGKTDTLYDYLESLVGIRLDKDAQNRLIERVNHRVDGRMKKRIDSINYAISNIHMENLPFHISNKVVKETIDGVRKNQTYWEVFSTRMS